MVDLKKDKLKILSVDDEATNRLIIESYFKNDFDVKSAVSGKEALEYFMSDTEFDIILLDVMMPEMDGVTLCKKIRETVKGKDIPIIFVSAKGEAQDIVFALENGGNDFVTKPFRPIELKARIESQLKVRNAQKLVIQNENLKTIKNLMVRLNHEVRNALTIISATIRIVTIPEDEKDRINTIQSSIDKITNILNKIENLNEIKTTKYLEGVDMLDIDKN